MKKIRVAHLGLGKRGATFIKPFLEMDEFELVGICDRNKEHLQQRQSENDLNESIIFSDLDTMLLTTKPDVLCFVTHPSTRRLPIVKKAVKYGVKGIIFEKPAANTLKEVREIRDICDSENIKAVVCHQMKYAKQFQKLKECLNNDKLGKIYEINLSCSITANITQVFTHGLDILLWLNDYNSAKWVTGHMNGSSSMDGIYPSPDYVCGRLKFENGLYSFFEAGSLASKYIYDDAENIAEISLIINGKCGQAIANMSGDWKVSTDEGKCSTGKEPSILDIVKYELHFPFLKDFALWMNDDNKVHSSNIENAYKISEILEAIYISAAYNKKVDINTIDNSEGNTIDFLNKYLKK